MVKRYDVSGVRSPGGRYSLVAEVEAASQLYFLAGQTGVDESGRTGDGITEQAEICYGRVKRILEECGLELDNLVRLTVYLTDPDDIEAWRDVEVKALGRMVPPAHTLLVVARLARPEFLIEVEAVAAG
ncbi:MAG: RidA family protein [Rhodospirillales bacterium]|jgi:enamine deaminase RidA (YjgF/YER057c/UK114 family)|nr:enamine deaminase RidA [Rhodospirillaceae bacterium]MDP6428648.1 RidA family protein [Rhodospirillales bacterium]MDP6645061.1 RidA family protein [Rhodospirillales bacterium]MDP6843760.1 RidA family protein [Rhodospirillales bacterium]|tara:strand:+ start:41 stop:427 length:387 start_codon:yes stop_codon:yes gene_type:complete